MVISSHVFICRPPKILGWRGRICGIALHPIATGLVSLPTIYWPFQGSPQGRKKNVALGPLFVAAREDRDSGKAEQACIHHKQNSRMGKL